MAVYTQLNEKDVTQLLNQFGWGQLFRLKATETGIENTNYFVEAGNGEAVEQHLVLTLFETMNPVNLPYFVALTTHLAAQGLPVPKPFCDQQQQAIHHLKGKPALLVPRLSGTHPSIPNIAQCEAIAKALASIHEASPRFHQHLENPRGARWRQQSLASLKPHLVRSDWEYLADQVMDWQNQLSALNRLPNGITHNDLFHDNALFVGDQLTGIIDFYNACDDVFIYDLAVLVNDWCSDNDQQLIVERYQAVLTAYQQIRPLTEAEKKAWPQMLQFAALRFYISRLLSWHDRTGNHQVTQKDPTIMLTMLKQRNNRSSIPKLD